MNRRVLLVTGLLAMALAGCGQAGTPTPIAESEIVAATVPPQAPATQAAVSGSCAPTPADQEGPYYKVGAPFTGKMAPDGLPGDRLILSGRVYAADCKTPLPGAVIDLWQADSTGQYDFSEKYILRGKVKTGDNGQYRMETIMPGYYEPRPLHIHIKVSYPGVETWTSQIYFAGDTRNAGVPAALLIAPVKQDGVLSAEFDIVLANSK